MYFEKLSVVPGLKVEDLRNPKDFMGAAGVMRELRAIRRCKGGK